MGTGIDVCNQTWGTDELTLVMSQGKACNRSTYQTYPPHSPHCPTPPHPTPTTLQTCDNKGTISKRLLLLYHIGKTSSKYPISSWPRSQGKSPSHISHDLTHGQYFLMWKLYMYLVYYYYQIMKQMCKLSNNEYTLHFILKCNIYIMLYNLKVHS